MTIQSFSLPTENQPKIITMQTTLPSAHTNKSARFSSVLDLVKATGGSDHARTFEQYLADTQIVKAMIRARSQASLTQADIASRMNCTQSAVSKLENSIDGDLTVREIASYLRATGGRFAIGFGKQPSLVERIKGSAMCLKAELDELADLSVATDDDKLRNGISEFFNEAWFNLFLILCDSTEKLPTKPECYNDAPVKLINPELHRGRVSAEELECAIR